MSASRVRLSLLVTALALGAPAALADMTTPSARPSPAPKGRQKSMLTRWPAVLPCPQPRDLKVSRTYPEDVVLWSNTRGDRVSQDGLWPLPPGFLRDRPRSLAWTPHGPERIEGIELPERVPRIVELEVKCGDDPALGRIAWECWDSDRRCRWSVFYPERDPDLRHRYRDDRVRVPPIMKAGADARNLLIADALQLIHDACVDHRCSDVVAGATARLRAAATQAPWTVTRPSEHRLELTVPGASDEKVSCADEHLWDGTYGEDCTLSLRGLTFDVRHGVVSGDAHDDGWSLRSNENGYSLNHEAAR